MLLWYKSANKISIEKYKIEVTIRRVILIIIIMKILKLGHSGEEEPTDDTSIDVYSQ